MADRETAETHPSAAEPARRRAGTWSVAAAGYLVLSLLNAWPIPLHFLTHLPSDLGDPVISTTILQWNATQAWFTDRWWNGVGYYPLTDTLTWSDPRLGLTLIAAPVYWATGSMVAGYNAAFVLSFALSALAAHLLVYTLTRSHAAAAVAGCAFGFAPFRAAHLAHLELLASYWMPVALLALHRWLATGRRRWLAALAAALVAQGLFCAYYLPMFGLVAAAWLLWFAPDRARPWRLAAPAAAGLVALGILMPLFLHYRAAHEAAGFERSPLEVRTYSAELNGLWSAAPALRLWPSLPTRSPEGQIFPGAAVIGLVAWYGWRTRRRLEIPRRLRFARRILLAVAAVAASAVSAAALFGPVRLEAGFLSISITELRKPLTIVLAALAAYAVLHPRVLEAARLRSAIAFYLLAAAVMVVLALGPDPTVYGVPFLYRAPYGWLMPLPGFDSLRAPARFAMPAALMLAIAAGLAWARLGPAVRRTAATAALAGVIVVEGWSAPVPALAPHDEFRWPEACEGLPRLELPTRTIEHGAAAQHRALLAGVRSVNGATGFVPPFAQVLEIAERTRPAGALSVLRPYAPLCVSVDPSREEARGADGRPDLAAWAGAHPGMSALESIDGRRFFLQEAAPRGEPLSGDPLPIARIGSWRGAVDTALLTDGDRVTAWRSRQISGAHLIIALECRADLTGLRLSQGAHLLGFPRRLAIQVARRRGPWRTVWQGATLERLAAGAIEDARLVPIEIPVAAEHVNRVRVRLLQPSRIPWAVAEVAVFGRCRGGGPE